MHSAESTFALPECQEPLCEGSIRHKTHFASGNTQPRSKENDMRDGFTKPTDKIPHSVIVRAPGLLPMLYKVRELAEELGISPRTIRKWAHRGMPHQRGSRDHIWVNGKEFAEWIENRRRSGRGPKLKPDEGYCMRCRRAVRLLNPIRQPNGKSFLLRGTCPRCGATVNRGMRDGESK